MDLIERYLQAVKFWLPKNQQDDITAELSEDLRAQIEERESKLGRKLNEMEVESLLRQRGSPIMVANGYLPQRQLIGPLLFPIYTFVLKVVTLCILIPAVVGWIAAIVSFTLRNATNAAWSPPCGPDGFPHSASSLSSSPSWSAAPRKPRSSKPGTHESCPRCGPRTLSRAPALPSKSPFISAC